MQHERDFQPYITVSGGTSHMDFLVEGIRCAGCMSKLEKGLSAVAGIENARLNMTTKRLAVNWQGALNPQTILDAVESLGFKAHPFQPEALVANEKAELKALLRALAVAGFGMANVMLLSVSIWFGGDISPETKMLFHWISAFIALPCGLYAGMPFFKSAYSALKRFQTNMDVPISIGVVLTLGLSLAETILHNPNAYFESALMLLFFLLIGRVLEQMMRLRARDFAVNVASLKPDTVRQLRDDGTSFEVPVAKIMVGDRILLLPGDRLAVDAIVLEGFGNFDTSLLTGESRLSTMQVGDMALAGSVNMGTSISLRVEKVENTFVDQAASLMEEALSQKSKTLNLANRAARVYAPVVHLTALLTFLGWLAVGAGVHTSLVIAISVLIITCPCALGLAIPAVQVVAGGSLFSHKLVLKNGDAIERLAEVDVVVFDKTGTLTMPELSVDETKPLPEGMMQLAAGLAKASNHPLAVALAHARPDAPILTGAIETPGAGVKLDYMGKSLSLGSAAFVGCEALKDEIISQAADQSLMFFKCDDAVYPLRFAQDLRPDAVETIQALKSAGLRVIMLSGDQPSAVKMAAKLLNIDEAIGGVLPQDKIAFINSLQNGGSRVLMVGDGLNDAPALAAAHVSLSPVTAAHIAQNAADATFLGAGLNPVVQAFYIARKAKKLMRQNLWLAVGYNVLAVPVAIMGFVTPMIAALAMSGSSILVTLNALRAKGKAPKTAQATNKPTLPSIVQEPA